MKHKIFAAMFALLLALSTVFGSLSAFAEEPAGDSSADEFIDSYFSDWEEAGEAAKVLRDQYKQFLYNICTQQGLEKILGDAKEIPIAWLRATKAGVYAISPLDNIYYWLVNGKLVFDDRSSGESVKKTIDDDISDPTIYVPSPWIENVNTSPGGSGSDTSAGIASIFKVVADTITNFLSGVFSPVFDFCTGNPLTLIILGISFIGIGIRYMRRVTNAFGRGR